MDKTTLETHDYDTRLTKVLTTKQNLSKKELGTFIKCLEEINKFLNEDKFLKVSSKINAQKTLHLLANDRKNNYDDRNKIHTELLVPIIWDKVKKYNELTIYDIFVEQLSDIIISGPCSQGRTTRLIQLLSI